MKIANINTSNILAWDDSYRNNWAGPASLNTYLNSTYYNSLNNIAQSQIVTSDFSIGAVTYENNNMSTQVSDENSTLWNGNIALPTVSEYIRTNSDKSICGTFKLIIYNYSCLSTGWMDNNESWWTLSANSGTSYLAFDVDWYGHIGSNGYVYTGANGVRPALYLSSEVKLSGSGTQSDPYVVS